MGKNRKEYDAGLPEVDFCGIRITRLVLGGNPFAGFSHQSAARDEEMISYYTVERIIETWERAASAGITAMVTNNETPHVVRAVEEYLSGGGSLKWIAQVNKRTDSDMAACIDRAVSRGCSALYFHGGAVDRLYREKDEKSMVDWLSRARETGVPAGVAGHDPGAHNWVDGFGLADFHAVSFFNCGSVHSKKYGAGYKFKLGHTGRAVEFIRRIHKPCIAYKIMAAGRIDPRMAFEYAFENIKPSDAVNVGVHRGDKDAMVEENASIAGEILARDEGL